MKHFVIVLILLLALFSCQKLDDDDRQPVAAIYDKVLYQSDLQDAVYEGISKSDSIVQTKAFINNWIRRQVLLHQAEDNLKKSEMDFSKQVEDYRNSLIIYKYESQYVAKNLDTVVSDLEISNFMKANSTMEIDKESVRQIILNMRKKTLVEKMNNNLYNKAVKDNVFVIY